MDVPPSVVSETKFNNKDEQEIHIAFIGTVYNNNAYVQTSLKSLFKVIELLRYLAFEIIIVDNFSDDGTYEKLLELKRSAKQALPNLKRFIVVRAKSSRGLGREIALMISRAEYVVPIDLDTYYDSSKLSTILNKILKLKIDKCVVLANPGLHLICPRTLIIKIGGYKNLNYGEDIELLARIFCTYLNTISFPLKIAYDLRMERDRERRYTKTLGSYILRKMCMMRDRYIAYGYSLTKIVREYYFLYKSSIVSILFSVLIHIVLRILNLKVKKFEADKKISNYVYVDYMTHKTMINPSNLGLEENYKESYLEYFKNFHNSNTFIYISRYRIQEHVN